MLSDEEIAVLAADICRFNSAPGAQWSPAEIQRWRKCLESDRIVELARGYLAVEADLRACLPGPERGD